MKHVVIGLMVLTPAMSAFALSPGTDVLVPAAGRGGGAGGSLWVTSMAVSNPGDEAATITVQWLVRNQANPSPLSVEITVPAGETVNYAQALDELFGIEAGGGALRVVSDRPVVVSAAILNVAGGNEFGQGFEGVPVTSALLPGDGSRALALRHGATHRSNIYVVDASGDGSVVTVRARDGTGAELGSKRYNLGAHMPVLEPLSALGIGQADGVAVTFEVESGAVIGGASRIADASGDPLTLEASVPAGTPGLAGCVPEMLTGLRFRVTHPIFGDENEFFEVAITSESAAEISDGNSVFEVEFEARSFGTGVIVLLDIPQYNLHNVRNVFLCASDTTGTLIGHGETPFGPQTISATVEILP
jgi:hypothetical protein